MKKEFILVSLLALAVVSYVPLVSAASPSVSVTKKATSEGIIAMSFASSKTETYNSEILVTKGSGWKLDVQVAGSTDDEANPSICTYIDSSSGAVSLFVALQKWDPVNLRWMLQVFGSDTYGATWNWWYTAWWDFPATRSMINPSVAVSPYNKTVFVAVQHTAVEGLSNDIGVFRAEDSTITHYDVDNDADDDRSPKLVSEYSFGLGNALYVSYEKYTSYDDRDLYLGRSTEWGLTWSRQLLRGGALDFDVYTQSSIAFVQRNLYVACRHSTDFGSTGHIDVLNSSDWMYYFTTWSTQEDVSKVPNDASWPSLTGAHIGPWNKPANVMVAYQYATTPTNDDILITWWTQIEDKWTGGNDWYHQIATSAVNERMPALTIDGMGTESGSVGGNYHLVYWTDEDTGTRTNGLYYTQLQYWDVSLYYGGSYSYTGHALGWSTPKGMIVDDNAYVSAVYPKPTITSFNRTVGGASLWMPGVAWTDYRNSATTGYDIYYTTPGTDFSITFVPSSQSVVAGKSLSYYVTVNLLAGTTSPAQMAVSNWIAGSSWAGSWWTASYSVNPITPTATTTLTINTSNLHAVGTFSLNITATIGGYRRIVAIPFTVTAPPTLTLDINPTTVARGQKVTFSGQLSPSLGTTTTIYLYYRVPHQTGSWKLATTIKTNTAGAYSLTITIPNTAAPGTYDFVTFWVNTANGSYATSPIKVLTIT